jgi:ribosome-associated protein
MIRDRRPAPADAEPDPEAFDPATAPPSKGMRKRAALRAQDLGERLIALRESELQALQLPETLYEAIRLAQRIQARGGLARQRQYIGKLMRDIDPAPIEAALDVSKGFDARESERFRRIEAWRGRLVAEGEAALQELLATQPGLERARLEPLLARARGALGDAERATAARALFRELRAQFEALDPARAGAARDA